MWKYAAVAAVAVGCGVSSVLSATGFLFGSYYQVFPTSTSNWQFFGTGGGLALQQNQILTITGPDSGMSGARWMLIELPSDGVFAFDWEYTSKDAPGFDKAFYFTSFGAVDGGVAGIPGSQIDLTDESGMSGTVCIEALDGHLFGFGVFSMDGVGGPGELTITNFRAPQGFANDLSPAEFFVGAGSIGSVNTSNAPNSITITGSDDGSTLGAFYDYCVTIPADGVIEFDWSYASIDAAGFDEALFFTTELGFVSLADADGANGTQEVGVSEGDTLCFTVESDDSVGGPGQLTIDNLQFRTGFAGQYGTDTWFTNTIGDGSVDTSGAPLSVEITGPDDGSFNFGFTDYSNFAAADGIISFRWSYSSIDSPGFDTAIFNSSSTGNVVLSDTSGESGFACFELEEGEFFRLTVESDDSTTGPGVLTITEFNGPIRLCAGDLNNDRVVNQSDLGILLASFGTNNGGDLDGDGDTDQSDLGILLAAFGGGCQLPN